MATVNKDFKIKSGLIVEGTTATVNGYDVLTKKQADQDYVVGLIGGTATAENTPDTVVKRDGSGGFAAGTVTATDINIGSIGHIWDDGDLMISNVDGMDVILQGEDIRLNAQDDVRLNAGTGGDVFIQATSGNINLQGPNVYVGENLNYVDSERVASQGYVDDSIAAIDLTYTTDDVTEGTNLYFTDSRAQTAVSNALGTGLSYGDQGSGNVFHVDENHISTKAYADAAADAAYANAQDYAELKASDAQAAAIETASQDATTKANNAQSAAESFATQAIADLVDSAPATLDTLNELAAALQDNPDIISDLQDIASGKQDTLTAGSNIDITGTTISVTGLDTADVAEDASRLYFTDQRALDATSEAYDAAGAAQTAEDNAIAHADALTTTDIAEGDNLYFTNQRAIDAVGGTIGEQIDLLTTDDIEEGEGNLYFTDSRAKTSAADLLTGANLTNITITGTGAGLTITAENGVADSTTDDLAEGETNLYFQDERAFDAVSNTNIRFETVEITWVRREEATWTNVATASQIVCHQAGSNIGSMKYLVRTTAMVGGTRQSHVTELLATVDGSNGVAVVEYGTIYTSENPLATATVLWNGLTNCYELNVTTANNNSEVMVAATLMSAVD